MILLLAAAVAVVLAAGTFLLLDRDLVRVAGGALLISQSANLFLMAAGLMRGRAPLLPVPDPGRVSDPLTHALTLTAMVISFGTAALLLALLLRVHATHGTIDLHEVVEVEREAEAREEVEGLTPAVERSEPDGEEP